MLIEVINFNASYEVKTVPLKSISSFIVYGINLNDETRINTKDAGTLILDYELSSVTNFFFTTFFLILTRIILMSQSLMEQTMGLLALTQ